MITTISLIDRINEVNSWTDYRVSKELGTHTSTLSNWRNRGSVMSDEIGLKVAEILGWEPKVVLMSLHAERAMNSPVFDILKEVAEEIEAGYQSPKTAKKRKAA